MVLYKDSEARKIYIKERARKESLCACGLMVKYCSKAGHLKSKKHTQIMELLEREKMSKEDIDVKDNNL